MSTTSAALPLAAEFPAATREAWLKQVEKALKGGDFQKRLVTRSADGFDVAPLSPRRKDAAPAARAAAGPWLVSQRIDLPNPIEANAQALDDLMSGANALTLVFADSPVARGFGLKDASRDTLTRALAQIELAMGVTLDLDLGPASRDAGAAIAAIARAKDLAPAQLDIKFGLDPVAAVSAGAEKSMPAWLAETVKSLARAGFKGPFVACDGRAVHAAGGSEAQELAFVLASAVAYLRALEAGGMALAAARDALYVRLTADADQFMTIAKFRALRRLWARVEAACGLAPAPLFIAAETAWRMQTRRDPQVTMLRNTVAVFAAAVGGADMITVLPHTSALGLADSAARRLARNTQVVLAEEANIFRIVDPGAGAGAVETLTEQLCAAAWAQFQTIEAAGGVIPALTSGAFAAQVAAVKAARLAAIGTRKAPLTGVSEFPNVTETPPPVLAPARIAPPAGALAPGRLAEPFEALRDAADAATAKRGARPAVFLANLGTVADFTARTIFAKNLFEAGGFSAPANDGFATLDALVAAYQASGAAIACLCSSDAVYASEGAAAARALGAAGARVWVAARPGEATAALEAAGADGFIFAGCDVVAALTRAQTVCGVV